MLRSVSLVLLSLAGVASTYTPLNITALSSRGGYSVLECWQLETVPVEAMSAMNYDLGDSVKATWSVIQPRTTVGEAWAPTVQLSVILNGMIRITSPAPAPVGAMSSPGVGGGAAAVPEQSVAYVLPGTLASSVVIAADLKSASTLRGHFTEFPSDEPTVLVQVPFEGNVAPRHSVLHDGACRPPAA
ncbi:hypothetical protein MAPG_02949 [Magnaporthiopsis poae ATCC 64411]|uniref:Small secreted protein n=1 Tax=Magnaporthiopsis poae (strain ATCC 64411 / 73-15) TaxID=644358 RepID=A0A0C4DSR1_MAGP6|nr:hypothetical protein MAPG_02949 [Magnaporthiopsis poae ATCC 64411]